MKSLAAYEGMLFRDMSVDMTTCIPSIDDAQDPEYVTRLMTHIRNQYAVFPTIRMPSTHTKDL